MIKYKNSVKSNTVVFPQTKTPVILETWDEHVTLVRVRHTNNQEDKKTMKKARVLKMIAVVAGIILFFLFCMFALRWTGSKVNTADYHFSGELIARRA